MAKGDVNPLTTVLLEAERIVLKLEVELLESFGLPLYVVDVGRGVTPGWPADPDDMSPEQMQVLIDSYGEMAVNEWVIDRVREKSIAESDGSEF